MLNFGGNYISMEKNFLEEAQELFGEQRYFTPEEQKIYKEVTKEDSVSTGINIFDLLREKNEDFPEGFFQKLRPIATKEKDDEETYVPLSKDDIVFVNEEAEKLWDALMKLEKFRCYGKNWNGYDADPFSDELISFVKKIIIDLDIIPEIFPVADGSIQLEYTWDNKYLEFQVFEDKSMSWYYEEGDTHREGAFYIGSSNAIKSILEHFK